MTPQSPEAASDLAALGAWRFLTHDMAEAEAEAFVHALSTSPEAIEALEEAAEDVVLLRCLGDADLRAELAGPASDGLEVQELLTLDHDPDARLDAALADGAARQSAWDRFRSFAVRRSTHGMALVLLAAAMALLVVGRPPEPVPDYRGAWANGGSKERGPEAQEVVLGRYLVLNEPQLVLFPPETGALDDPEVRVFVGKNGGALEPIDATTKVGKTRAVLVRFEVSPELGVGTHRVVVLLGHDLDGADPETDTDAWTRIEEEMLVVDKL